jgi:uncharacterized tellurite resistance protein B-like protein
MLNKLTKLLFPAERAAGPSPADDDHALKLATAVMLVEVMRADTGFRDDERDAVRAGLIEKFALSAEEADALAELAHTTARQATDFYRFTSVINDRFEMPAKLRMIELMWRVAYADGRLSDHERHTLWRIADLLHVPQGAYVLARQRAEQAAAQRGDAGG